VLAADQHSRIVRIRTGEAIVEIGRVGVRLDVDVVNLQLQLRLATAREAAIHFDGQHFLAARSGPCADSLFLLDGPPSPVHCCTFQSSSIVTSFWERLHFIGIKMPTEATKVSRAGITTSASGERHIPSSVRPDGSVRKEIKVRPGYRPPEDVELYKNRTAEAYKNRGKAGVPGADTAAATPEAPSAAANKNAKRREARKKAAATAPPKDDPPTPATTAKQPPAPVEPAKEIPVDSEAEKTKEAKKLTKKLRQARELQDKKEKGDALLPEQFQKVIKINELIRQLETLGFDSNGDKKSIQAES
jgi:partner of Y14 and mago protein